MSLLTEQDAFRAMVIFIDDYWKRTGRGEEIAMLLGDIAIVSTDGEPADPAMIDDWSSACRRAREDRGLR